MYCSLWDVSGRAMFGWCTVMCVCLDVCVYVCVWLADGSYINIWLFGWLAVVLLMTGWLTVYVREYLVCAGVWGGV